MSRVTDCLSGLTSISVPFRPSPEYPTPRSLSPILSSQAPAHTQSPPPRTLLIHRIQYSDGRRMHIHPDQGEYHRRSHFFVALPSHFRTSIHPQSFIKLLGRQPRLLCAGASSATFRRCLWLRFTACFVGGTLSGAPRSTEVRLGGQEGTVQCSISDLLNFRFRRDGGGGGGGTR